MEFQFSMRTMRMFILVVALTLATTQGLFLKETNEPSTGEIFLNDVRTAVDDIKDSAFLKEKALIGATTAIGKATVGVLKDIKGTKTHILKNIIATKLSKLQAIKDGKLAFLRTLANAFQSPADETIRNAQLSFLSHPLVAPYFENEEEGSEIPWNPFLDLVVAIFAKFHGEYSKKEQTQDHIMIGDQEYIFVPLPSYTESHGYEEPEKTVVPKYSPTEGSSDVPPRPSVALATTLPPSMHDASGTTPEVPTLES